MDTLVKFDVDGGNGVGSSVVIAKLENVTKDHLVAENFGLTGNTQNPETDSNAQLPLALRVTVALMHQWQARLRTQKDAQPLPKE